VQPVDTNPGARKELAGVSEPLLAGRTCQAD
jgi:hypothetical protein